MLNLSHSNTTLRLAAILALCAGFTPFAPAQTAPSVFSQTTLPEVLVTASGADGSAENGYRVGEVSVGPLGKMPLQDTPFSINATSAQLIQNLQAQSTTSALKTNPTVAFDLPENRAGAYFTIRGFLNNLTAVDGIRNPPSWEWEFIEDKERIEVFNGPTSFLYGISDAGGMINYVLKRPTEKPMANLTLGDYGGTQGYAHLDCGGPLDADGKFGYRVNLLYVVPGSTGVDFQSHERFLASAAFDWHITPGTTLSLDGSYGYRNFKGYQAFFRLGNITELPSPPNPFKNYGEPYAYSKDSYTRAGIELKSKLNDIFTVRSAFRYTYAQDTQVNVQDVFVNNQGDYNQSRSWAGWNPYQSFTYHGHLYVDAEFQTGPIGHKMTAGCSDDLTYFTSAYPSTSVALDIPPTFISSLSHPTYYKPYPGTVKNWNTNGPFRTIQTVNFLNIMLSDLVTINKQWSLLLGVNYAAILDKTWDPATGAKLPTNNSGAFTPCAALMFKPIPAVTLYASYIEALTEGETAPMGSANANQILAPYLANQVELGVKTTLGTMSLNCALFRIDKAFAYTDPSDNVYKANGRQVNMGIEFVASGKVFKDLTLCGGFTLLDARIEKTAPGDPSSGKVPDAVPRAIARVYAEYDVPFLRGFTLTGGVNFTGSEFVDGANANTMSIPGAITGDIGARYKFQIKQRDVTLRLNVNNFTNNTYWSTWQGGRVYANDPITFAFSAELAWF